MQSYYDRDTEEVQSPLAGATRCVAVFANERYFACVGADGTVALSMGVHGERGVHFGQLYGRGIKQLVGTDRYVMILCTDGSVHWISDPIVYVDDRASGERVKVHYDDRGSARPVLNESAQWRGQVVVHGQRVHHIAAGQDAAVVLLRSGECYDVYFGKSGDATVRVMDMGPRRALAVSCSPSCCLLIARR
eukprot:TRINITY_DN10474_c0_g2_i1.p2 TRINITY_DN10474_c0_g2~~TRINITY_DN10474_c0_g2_i1.p2  ORF type:complete len:191 (+),score=42.00 TRINITY_DN10474_c0_g2_i1:914-1486(+)